MGGGFLYHLYKIFQRGFFEQIVWNMCGGLAINGGTFFRLPLVLEVSELRFDGGTGKIRGGGGKFSRALLKNSSPSFQKSWIRTSLILKWLIKICMIQLFFNIIKTHTHNLQLYWCCNAPFDPTFYGGSTSFFLTGYCNTSSPLILPPLLNRRIFTTCLYVEIKLYKKRLTNLRKLDFNYFCIVFFSLPLAAYLLTKNST